MKWCYKCGETKPADEFYKDSRAKDKLQSLCKACCRAYAQSDRGKEVNVQGCRKYAHSDKGEDSRAEINSTYYQNRKYEYQQKESMRPGFKRGHEKIGGRKKGTENMARVWRQFDIIHDECGSKAAHEWLANKLFTGHRGVMRWFIIGSGMFPPDLDPV